MDLRSNRHRVLQEIDVREMEIPRSPVMGNQQLPDSLLTPSPDEQIIKGRGRRKSSGGWDACNPRANVLSYLHTPDILKTPTKSDSRISSNPVRSSPRKRLQVDGPISPLSPSKLKVQSQLVKRQRNQHNNTPSADPETAIRGLSHIQLVDMLGHVMHKYPNIKQEIASSMPLPDLAPLEEKLNCLLRTVCKSSSGTRLGSVGDASHYNRVKIHLNEFKKVCIEQGKILMASHQWSSVIDYALLAWNYVNGLPDWDSPAHSKIKDLCFSSLASHCMAALKNGTFDVEHYQDVKDRLEEAKSSCRDIEPCINFIENVLKRRLELSS